MRQLIALFIIFLILLVATARSDARFPTLPLKGVETTVTPTVSSVVYRWTFETSSLGRGLSHVEIFYCPTAVVTNAQSNVRFDLESRTGRVKFDEISTSESTVWFQFESIYGPTTGTLRAKAGPRFYLADVQVPGCQIIPEVSTALLASTFLLLFALRRRR